MRIKLTFSSPQKLVLPIHYNRQVQGMIYNNISCELANFLHDEGFLFGERSFKLFCFSRINGRFYMRKDRKIEFASPITLVVTSPVERFLQELAEGMLKNEELNLLGQRLYVESVEVIPTPDVKDFEKELTIKMMSPVVAYSSVKKDRGQKTFYFSPWDEWFSELLRGNLEKKHQLITGKDERLGDVEIIPTTPKHKKYCKIMSYKGTVIKGWMGIYQLKGDPRLLKTAYDAGLGSKNPQGFGCFEVI